MYVCMYARAASQIDSKLNERNRMIGIINNININKFAWRKYPKIFLKAIFCYSGKLSSKFLLKLFVIILCDIIGL